MTPAMRRAGILTLVLGCAASAAAAEPPPAEEFLHRSQAGWRAVAGDFIWLKLGDEKQPRFIAALRTRLVTNCARGRTPGTLTLLGTRQRPDSVSLTARMQGTDDAERILVWRLRPGGPWGWQATDVSADGISLSSVLHEEVRAAYDAAQGDAEAAITGLANGAPLQ